MQILVRFTKISPRKQIYKNKSSQNFDDLKICKNKSVKKKICKKKLRKKVFLIFRYRVNKVLLKLFHNILYIQPLRSCKTLS